MNEELETALSQLIQKTLSGMDAAVGFGQEQLPDVIQQVINFNLAVSVSSFFASMLTIIALAYGLAKSRKRNSDGELNALWDRWGEPSEIGLVVFLFGGFAGVLAVCFLFDSGYMAAKIILAPKVWLIEYAANLIN